MSGAPTILTVLDHYLPGYKAGGPVRSVESLVDALGGEFRFRIASRDRDCGDQEPYPGTVPGTWYPAGKGEVTYLTAGDLSVRGMRALMRSAGYDVLYLNSLFSPRMTLLPLLLRRLRMVPVRPVVLAPRGELHPGALRAPRKWRMQPTGRLLTAMGLPSGLSKRLYIAAGRAFGLFNGVVWQASGPGEREDIMRHIGSQARVRLASCLVLAPPPSSEAREAVKEVGRLRVAYLSRIHPKKNLEGAIAALHGLRGEVEFNIYGPVDDPAYWTRCQALLRRLPGNVRWSYHGPIPHEQVSRVLSEHDVFLLLTWGENFGHVIVEALLSGCPVLISDRTPWVDLERYEAGWDYPFAERQAVSERLQRLLNMGQEEHARWRVGAASLGRRIASNPRAVQLSRELFLSALPRAGAGASPAALAEPFDDRSRALAARPVSHDPGGFAPAGTHDAAQR